MATKLFLITSKFHYWACYDNTVFHVEEKHSVTGATNVLKENAKDLVRLKIYAYALTFKKVQIIEHTILEDITYPNVIMFLKRQTKTKIK